MTKFLTATAMALTLTACEAYAAGHAAPIAEADSKAGTILVSAEGMSLYTFDRDDAGKSNCNGGCAASWPPLEAAASAHDNGDFTIVTRKDGSKQWAYKGAPLYGWVQDRKPGDVTGDGVGGTWHLARP